MSYAFPPDLQRAVDERMAAGGYSSADALLLNALRALDELERRHRELREEVQRRVAKAGQGQSAPLDVDALMAEGRRRLNAQ